MAYRPYPNADRALNNLRRQQAVYQYGRFPQRYVMGMDLADQIDRIAWRMGLAAAAHAYPVEYPMDTYRLSSRGAGRVEVAEGASGIAIAADSIRPWTQQEREIWYRTGWSPQPAPAAPTGLPD